MASMASAFDRCKKPEKSAMKNNESPRKYGVRFNMDPESLTAEAGPSGSHLRGGDLPRRALFNIDEAEDFRDAGVDGEEDDSDDSGPDYVFYVQAPKLFVPELHPLPEDGTIYLFGSEILDSRRNIRRGKILVYLEPSARRSPFLDSDIMFKNIIRKYPFDSYNDGIIYDTIEDADAPFPPGFDMKHICEELIKELKSWKNMPDEAAKYLDPENKQYYMDYAKSRKTQPVLRARPPWEMDGYKDEESWRIATGKEYRPHHQARPKGKMGKKARRKQKQKAKSPVAKNTGKQAPVKIQEHRRDPHQGAKKHEVHRPRRISTQSMVSLKSTCSTCPSDDGSGHECFGEFCGCDEHTEEDLFTVGDDSDSIRDDSPDRGRPFSVRSCDTYELSRRSSSMGSQLTRHAIKRNDPYTCLSCFAQYGDATSILSRRSCQYSESHLTRAASADGRRNTAYSYATQPQLESAGQYRCNHTASMESFETGSPSSQFFGTQHTHSCVRLHPGEEDLEDEEYFHYVGEEHEVEQRSDGDTSTAALQLQPSHPDYVCVLPTDDPTNAHQEINWHNPWTQFTHHRSDPSNFRPLSPSSEPPPAKSLLTRKSGRATRRIYRKAKKAAKLEPLALPRSQDPRYLHPTAITDLGRTSTNSTSNTTTATRLPKWATVYRNRNEHKARTVRYTRKDLMRHPQRFWRLMMRDLGATVYDWMWPPRDPELPKVLTEFEIVRKRAMRENSWGWVAFMGVIYAWVTFIVGIGYLLLSRVGTYEDNVVGMVERVGGMTN